MYSTLLRILFLCVIVTPTAVRAAEIGDSTQRFFAKHCLACHSDDTKEGGLDLKTLTGDLSDRAHVERWTRIYDRVAKSEMPPEGEPRPDATLQRAFLASIATPLKAADSQLREVVQRRLNREEYQYTVRDLLGLDIELKQLLPEDQQAGGFDNNGEALAISAELMGQYLQAAETAIDAAIVHGDQPKSTTFVVDPGSEVKNDIPKYFGLDSDRTVIYTTDNGNYSKLATREKRTPTAGRYRFKFEAATHHSADPIIFNARVSDFDGLAATNINLGYLDATAKPKTFELEAKVGERSAIQFFLIGLTTWINDASSGEFAGVGFGPVEITGPLFDQWPPASHQKLIGDVDLKTGTMADAERILRAFIPRAFRRPATEGEISRYVALVKQRMAAGRSFETSLKGLAAVLCSPSFLYLREDNSEGKSQISDYELASRLSYFLWSSMPDTELLECAQKQTLRQPKVLHAQVERLLNDPRQNRFITDFTGQWLKLRQIDATTPDARVYAEFDDFLKVSMVAESQGFFRTLLDEDLSIRNFLDSDFVMLNARLARHYGIEGVQGVEIRKTSLPKESVRGGALTQGAVLKVTANGTNTSPVVRGVWVLENFLGQITPPPPPNVGGIEPDIRGATTIREQLDKHRSVESCNVCHRHIDPPGFALESFDPVGTYRDQYLRFYVEPQFADKGWGKVIKAGNVDPSGQLSTGEKFADVKEFKNLLLQNEDRFAKCLTEKLTTYALGRELGFSDREAIEDILKQNATKDRGLRSLVHAIVESPVFVRP
jgi:hypothetical protein